MDLGFLLELWNSELCLAVHAHHPRMQQQGRHPVSKTKELGTYVSMKATGSTLSKNKQNTTPFDTLRKLTGFLWGVSDGTRRQGHKCSHDE